MAKVCVRKHKLALVIACLLALFALVYSVPPHASFFLWQRLLSTLGYLVHGVLIIAVTFLYPSLDLPVTIVLLILMGLIVGLGVESLWNKARVGRSIVIILALLNAVIGSLVASSADVLVGRPYADCEQFVSDTNGIRIVAYPEIGVIPGAHFFFLATRDAGKTWEQIMVFRHDDPVEPPCENIRSLGPEHYWVWMGWKLTLTTSGGRTWQVWDLVETWPNWARRHYGLVEDVAFEDALHGCMVLHPNAWRGSTSELCTQDGGETWRASRQ